MPSNSRLLGMALARAWLRTYVRDPTHTREHAAEAVLLRLASRRAESAHAALLVRVDFLDLHELHGPFDRRRVELSELVARHVEEDGPVPLLLSGHRRALLRHRGVDSLRAVLQRRVLRGTAAKSQSASSRACFRWGHDRFGRDPERACDRSRSSPAPTRHL